jgi:lysophospholipase L1-like esterase
MVLKKTITAITIIFALIFTSSDLAYAADEGSTIFYKDDFLYEKASDYPQGDLSRLEAVIKKAKSGNDITVAFIGGSITEGTGVVDKDDSYVSLVYKWLCEQFPDINVNLINAGIGGTSSYLGLHRVDSQVLSYNPDLVFVEFAVNDTYTQFGADSYENLIRKILSNEGNPALVLLYTTNEIGYNAQAIEELIGVYYELPMISYGSAVLAAIDAGMMKWSNISDDSVHPNKYGHAIFARLIIRYLNNLCDNVDIEEETELTEEFEEVNITEETKETDAEEENGADEEAETESTKVELPKPYTQHVYYNPHIENALTLKPTDAKGYSVNNFNQYFKYNWYLMQKSSYVTFDVNAANIGIIYQRTADGTFGQYDVYVDNKKVATLDGNYKSGEGTQIQEQSLYISPDGTLGKHTVKIIMNSNSKNSQFIIAGLLIG